MKVFLSRVSTDKQDTQSQIVNKEQYDLILEDIATSGVLHPFERPSYKKLKPLIESGKVNSIYCYDISRLSRNTKDLLDVIDVISKQHQIPIHFIREGLVTLNNEGEIPPTTQLIINILGSIAELERETIRQRIKTSLEIKRQREGYTHGRKKGSVESIDKFLSKPRSKKIKEYLDKGYSVREISKILETSTTTIVKVRKYSTHTHIETE